MSDGDPAAVMHTPKNPKNPANGSDVGHSNGGPPTAGGGGGGGGGGGRTGSNQGMAWREPAAILTDPVWARHRRSTVVRTRSAAAAGGGGEAGLPSRDGLAGASRHPDRPSLGQVPGGMQLFALGGGGEVGACAAASRSAGAITARLTTGPTNQLGASLTSQRGTAPGRSRHPYNDGRRCAGHAQGDLWRPAIEHAGRAGPCPRLTEGRARALRGRVYPFTMAIDALLKGQSPNMSG